ncbi:MAG: type II secretion system F family protein [Candidatus Pacebacteria bacterium]|nr:type II secretion system F family protein [Candidatus Paceibacterota bacterium]
MPIFHYTAKQSPTVTVNGDIEATSEDEAIHKLSTMGLSPLHVEPVSAGVAMPMHRAPEPVPTQQSKSSQIVHSDTVKVRSRDIDRFTRQLATLVRTNVPILRALALIAEQPGSETFRNVIRDLATQVQQGRTLSDAMAKYPRIFDNLYLSMVLAGERGGVLHHTLLTLANHREKELEMRRQVQSALAYPLFVVGFGMLTVFVVITFFLPRVIGLFQSLEQDLPLPTEILVTITEVMSEHWPWALLIGALIAAIVFRNKPGSKKKLVVDILKLSLPVVRRLTRHAEIARFSRTLALLTRSGISIHEGLALATKTLNNEAMKGKIEQVVKDIVNKGETLSVSLTRSGEFPRFATNMIAVGEEGGELPGALDEVATVYEREVGQSVKVLMSLLEPILILVVGGIVAFIVFAMLLPIFDIGGF